MGKISLGIDLGSSMTKIAGFSEGSLLIPNSADKAKPAEELISDFLRSNSCSAADIDSIAVTGAGAAAFESPLFNNRMRLIDEFTANRAGGEYFANGEDPFMVVSMGTGTSFVAVDKGRARHMGGIGIGGGTIMGLSRLILETDDIELITKLSEAGSAANTDMRISDISDKPVAGLDMAITVSNFGKAQPELRLEDKAAGIVHMVLESIFQSAALIARDTDIKLFVLIGSVSCFPQCAAMSERIRLLSPEYDFIVPKHSAYGTAIGAALAAQQ